MARTGRRGYNNVNDMFGVANGLGDREEEEKIESALFYLIVHPLDQMDIMNFTGIVCAH